MAQDYERIYMKAAEEKAYRSVTRRFDGSLGSRQQVNSLRKQESKSKSLQ
jgi:hypothetical protein